jgi:hypothetical protein
MKTELRNVKINKALSAESCAFSAVLYIDGVKAADVSNHGTGGENMIHFRYRPDLAKPFTAFCEAQPPSKYEGGELKMDEDLYISILIGKYEEQQEFKRWCKTNTVFRLVGDDKGVYHKIKEVFTPDTKAFLGNKYGAQLEVIINETLNA